MVRSTTETGGTRRRSQRLKVKYSTRNTDTDSDVDLPQDKTEDLKSCDMLDDTSPSPETAPVGSPQEKTEAPMRGESGSDSGGYNDDVGERDSEDEAPEDVSLAVSKQVSMETRKSEQDHIKRIDEAVKEKRRRKHELFRTQKMSKTAKSLAKFPQEALEEVSLKLAEEKASKRAKKRMRQRLNRRRRLQEKSLPTEARHGTVTVVTLDEHTGSQLVGGALTNDFRQQHFYGDRLKRLPYLSIQAKKYRKLPAKNFIKS